MARSHVSHDCYLEEGVGLSTNVCLGGWTRLMKSTNMGLGSITHQLTTIGAYAMIAANATVVKDIPPLMKYIPEKPLSLHDFAIKKYGLPTDESYRSRLMQEWSALRREGRASY